MVRLASLASGTALNDQRNLAALTILSVVTRAHEAGRRDADRPARPARAAWAALRLLTTSRIPF
jgi:hypothetical protein